MIKFHTIGVLFLGMSIYMLGQTKGCNVDAIVNVFSQGSQGSNDDMSADDNGSDNQSGDDSNDDNSSDDVGDDSGDDHDGSGNPGEIILTAVLSGPGTPHGDAEYREEGNRMRLSVEMEDAVVGSVHQVSVNGIVIGELTIGSLGEGELEFDTEIESDHVPWPNALGEGLKTGATIVVGPIQGTLAG